MFLIKLEMVSRNSIYPRVVLLKVLSRSSIRESRIHISSKSLPGVLEERDDLDGAGDGVMVLKISQESFTESFIKIHHKEACISSKSLTGVRKDMEVPDGPGDGVGGSSIPIGTYTEGLMMIHASEL